MPIPENPPENIQNPEAQQKVASPTDAIISRTAEATEKASWTLEIVEDPNSQGLRDFHVFLTTCGAFTPEEVEPLEVFQAELARNAVPGFPAKFLCAIIKKGDEMVSGSYGSVQSGTLAIRLTATKKGSIGATAANRALTEQARTFCDLRSEKLSAATAECVPEVEAYANRMKFGFKPDRGLRRLYCPDSKTQVYYRLPPLEWNADGSPANDVVQDENLQIAGEGLDRDISREQLSNMLRAWWEVWYIRPRELFESDEAWERHKNTVWDILETEIFAPIQQYERLNLLSKSARES